MKETRSGSYVTLLLIVLVVAAALALALAACGRRSTAATGSSPPLSSPVLTTGPSQTTTSAPAAGGPGTIAFTAGAVTGPDNGISSLGLYVVRSDGAGLTLLAADGHHPAWSPDGSKIAYIDGEGVRVMNADGSGQRLVTEARAWSGWGSGARLAWSPDGTRIVFNDYAGAGEARNLYVVNVDGSGRRQVTEGQPGTIDEYPAWATDGRIFFARSDESRTGAICSLDPDGGGLTVVTAARAGSFSLSPDGKWLLMCKRDRLVRLAADGQGTDVVVLDHVSRYAKPTAFFAGASSWSPDGRKIALASDERAWIAPSALYIVNADGSEPKRVPSAGIGWNPVWQPR